MAGDLTKVDFGQVTALAEQITSQSSKIESELADLRQQISNLDQLWEGSASAGYQQTKQKWFQAADDLQQTLNKIGVAVHTASDQYSQTESKNAGLWG
ncbi:MAG TPA: WXG100 family type VII secretion target [Pseudonocardiaceae bacterium]|jgi:WXG100 family type VII secretion target|nr:WXG100 family type VII secretion target [Pseudonocardiaceae bacterium]